MTAPEPSLEPHKARMRELARAYAAQHPPSDALSLVEGLGVRLEYLDLGERDGALDPEHGLILVNKRHSPERQRFTLAHEVSHALLHGDDDLLSAIHDAYDGERLEGVIETLCNVGAAAMLIPEELLRRMIERYGATGQALAELSRRADVSASTAMYALSEAVHIPVIFAVAVAAKGKLTVRASAESAGVKYSLRPGTPIPEGHPVETAHLTNFIMTEQSYVPFRSGRKMPAYVVAFPQPGRVFASFQLEGGEGGGK